MPCHRSGKPAGSIHLDIIARSGTSETPESMPRPGIEPDWSSAMPPIRLPKRINRLSELWRGGRWVRQVSRVEGRRGLIEHRQRPRVVVHHPAIGALRELGLVQDAVALLDRDSRAPGGLAGGALEPVAAVYCLERRWHLSQPARPASATAERLPRATWPASAHRTRDLQRHRAARQSGSSAIGSAGARRSHAAIPVRP